MWRSQGDWGVLGRDDPELAPSRWRAPHGAVPVSCPCVLAVPTVPPGNVHAEATNSTTIRFTWNPPSPQFINGINQGYKVRVIPKNHSSLWGKLGQSLQTVLAPPL